MIMLAEAAPAPDAQFFYNLFLSLGFLASLTASVLAMVRGNRLQKREISMAPGLMPDPELLDLKRRMNEVETDLSQIRTEIKADYRLLETHNENRVSGLHERINQVLAAVSELRGELRQQARMQ